MTHPGGKVKGFSGIETFRHKSPGGSEPDQGEGLVNRERLVSQLRGQGLAVSAERGDLGRQQGLEGFVDGDGGFVFHELSMARTRGKVKGFSGIETFRHRRGQGPQPIP